MSDFDGKGVHIECVETPEVTQPVMIEGLPGVGYVGKLAVQHLLAERDQTLVRRIYSEHLPPRVTIDDRGVGALASVDIYHVPTETVDLLLVDGDQQAQTAVGYYRLTEAILEVAESFGVGRVYPLGGVPTGELMESYAIIGAVSEEALIEPLEAEGVEFRDNQPAGGVVGISGLLLGLGARRSIEVACLMGETSGYLVDPNSARAVLAVLEGLLGFAIDDSELEERAEQMEGVVKRLEQLQDQPAEVSAPEESLRYID